MTLTTTSNFISEATENMKEELTQFQLLTELNKHVANRITKRVIHELKVSKFPKLSGDDSPLKNCWDEICVQVQDERSFDWWAYEDSINSTIESHLKKEPEVHRLLLSYMSPRNNDYDTIAYYESDAIESIYQEVISIAMNYRNKEIDNYLNR
jgi:hypothetical protein